jgi:YVTN family beta-propeller protein
MARFWSRWFCALALIALATPATAQPYLYSFTNGGFFANDGLNIVPLPPRLIAFDAATSQALNSLDLTCQGAALGIKPDGTRIYVGCSNGAMLVIDPAAKAIVATVSLSSLALRAVAVTPNGQRVLVAGEDGMLRVVDTGSLTILATVDLGAPAAGVAPSPDNTRAYVTTHTGGAGVLRFVDIANGTIANTVTVGLVPSGVAVTPSGGRALVVNSGSGTVSVIDTVAASIVTNVTIPAGTNQIDRVDIDGAFAYIAVRLPTNQADRGIRILDLATNALTGFFAINGPSAALPNSAAGRLYVRSPVFFSRQMVQSLDIATGVVLASGQVQGGSGMVFAPSAPTPPTDPCTYTLSVGNSAFSPAVNLQNPNGTFGQLVIIALPDRCAWTAQVSDPWITLDRMSGTGPDSVRLTIAANATGAARTGTVSVGGQTLTISQAGCLDPIVVFDNPQAGVSVSQPLRISGWAIERCAVAGTGLRAPSGETYNYGIPRPDVAAIYGGQFLNSGFDFVTTFEYPPGARTISVTFVNLLTNSIITGSVPNVIVLPSARPFGSVDTPAEGATVAGEMPFTGWVLDDVALIGNLLVYRNALPGETPNGPNNRIFVGLARRIAGTRPDVQTAFPGYPENDRAGFGLMVLTNMLPNGGNGTFTFSIDVADRIAQVTLGSRTVTANNAASVLPFGTIDTPAQGATVSGIVTNFGWALTPQPYMIPLDGSTIDVLIDGVFAGHPSYNHFRSDIATAFPGYANSGGAVGVFTFDSRTLSNGLHTIEWIVRDNAGNAQGMGSRFFTVANP